MSTPSDVRGHIREPTVFTRPTELENQVTRLFHAPRDRVYKIFTDPATFRDAFATDPALVTVEKYDFRQGGEFAIVLREKDGTSMRFWGEYREIVPGRRVVFTVNFREWPGVAWVQTEEYADVGTFTRLTVRFKFDSREHRDMVPGAEGENGTRATWDHVADLLGSP